MGKRQSFTREFKLEAVRLLRTSGRPAAEVARKCAKSSFGLYLLVCLAVCGDRIYL